MRTLSILIALLLTRVSVLSQVLITEVHATPLDGQSEWVEIENLGGRSIRLDGWMICDEKTCEEIEGVSIPAGGRLVLDDVPSLNNTTDEVWLRKADSTVVDFMRYDMSDHIAGRSIERLGRVVGDSIIYEDRWESCRDLQGATPGLVNEAVQLHRDMRLEPLTTLDAAVRITLRNVGQSSMDGASIRLEIEKGVKTITTPFMLSGDVWTYDLGLQDLGWPDRTQDVDLRVVVEVNDERERNNVVEMSFVLPPEVGVIVINEILFDPWPDADDYVELACVRKGLRDITGWKLEDGRGEVAVIKDATVLDSGSIVVLAHGSILPAMDSGRPHHFAPSVNFNADGDVVALRTPSGFLVDRVEYRADWHVEEVVSKKGISLERLHPALTSNSPSSWASCSHASGGTPGRTNSVGLDVPDVGDLRAYPSPFSSDRRHSLHPTVLSFRQPFRHAIASIVVHRTDGTIVRRLLDAELIGSEGAVAWSGEDDSERRVAPGQYVVVLDCVDAASSAVHRERCVVVVGE